MSDSKPVKINLNEEIKVKLTRTGKEIYYHQYDEVNERWHRIVCEPTWPREDKDGYTTFQLWQFMSLYGEHMGMGRVEVIYPLDMIVNAPNTLEALENNDGRWIPCSEGLPPEDQDVFVYLFYNKCPYIAWVNDGHWRTDEFDVDKEYEPIAWMPLPKPYKEEIEEDEIWIHVGDEVEYIDGNTNAFVTYLDGGMCNLICADGSVAEDICLNMLRPTGRKCPEVLKLLETLQREYDDQ